MQPAAAASSCTDDLGTCSDADADDTAQSAPPPEAQHLGLQHSCPVAQAALPPTAPEVDSNLGPEATGAVAAATQPSAPAPQRRPADAEPDAAAARLPQSALQRQQQQQHAGGNGEAAQASVPDDRAARLQVVQDVEQRSRRAPPPGACICRVVISDRSALSIYVFKAKGSRTTTAKKRLVQVYCTNCRHRRRRCWTIPL